jgi:four helix bundle protein
LETNTNETTKFDCFDLAQMFEHPLEERCHLFAARVRRFCRQLKRDTVNLEDIKQLVRASGSIGANYIEANENVGKGDLKYRVKLCRKEAKESMHFLGLLETFGVKELDEERGLLVNEADQFKKIFSVMLNNVLKKEKDQETEKKQKDKS